MDYVGRLRETSASGKIANPKDLQTLSAEVLLSH